MIRKVFLLPNGYALQARINTETLNDQGELVPTGGTLQQFQLPGGPGIRVDTYAYAGYSTNPNFDSLLAKLIVHSKSNHLPQLLAKAERALSEVQISGIDTNVDFLRRLLGLAQLQDWQVTVRGVESRLKELMVDSAADGKAGLKQRFIAPISSSPSDSGQDRAAHPLDYPDGTAPMLSPLQAVLVSVEVSLISR